MNSYLVLNVKPGYTPIVCTVHWYLSKYYKMDYKRNKRIINFMLTVIQGHNEKSRILQWKRTSENIFPFYVEVILVFAFTFHCYSTDLGVSLYCVVENMLSVEYLKYES